MSSHIEFLMIIPPGYTELEMTAALLGNLATVDSMANGGEWAALTDLLVEIGSITEGQSVTAAKVFSADSASRVWVVIT